MPGAFRDSLEARGTRGVKLLFQHDPNEPIGVWLELNEDARGLFARGRLMPEVTRAREVLSLMRAGALDGLSIGFRTVQGPHRPRIRRAPSRQDRSVGDLGGDLPDAARGAGEHGEAADGAARRKRRRKTGKPVPPWRAGLARTISGKARYNGGLAWDNHRSGGRRRMLDFKDKVVLITGAAQGFGRVLANAFAERGAKLALCDINDEGGEETLAQVKALQADGFYQHADISRKRTWKRSWRRRSSASAGSMSPSTTPRRRSPARRSICRRKISARWSTPI